MEYRSGPVPQISSTSTNSPSTASPCHSHSTHCSLERFSHACRHACLRSFPAFNASFKCNHRRRGPPSLGAALGPTPRSFNNSKSLAGPIASPTLDFLCGFPFLDFGFLCEWPRNPLRHAAEKGAFKKKMNLNFVNWQPTPWQNVPWTQQVRRPATRIVFFLCGV